MPTIVRWPSVVKPGSVSNDIISHEDWLPTFLAAAGDDNVIEKLKKGHSANGRTSRFTSTVITRWIFWQVGAIVNVVRFFYFDDRASLNAVRVNDWKVHFSIGDRWFGGTQAFPQNFPRVTNLRMDPYEETIANMDHQPMYFRWAGDKLWIYQPLQTFVGKFLQSFKEFPQRQKTASFNINQVLDRMESAASMGR